MTRQTRRSIKHSQPRSSDAVAALHTRANLQAQGIDVLELSRELAMQGQGYWTVRKQTGISKQDWGDMKRALKPVLEPVLAAESGSGTGKPLRAPVSV